MEQELNLRMWQHKWTILGAKLTMDYRALNTDFTPESVSDYVTEQIHEYMNNGEFETQYQKAYEDIKDKLPDNYSTLL